MLNAKPKHAGKFSREALPPSIQYYKTQGIELKGKGAWLNALCPFHDDKKPSLYVNVERGAYRCFVCGAKGGDVLAFHQHNNKLNFVEACKQLGAWVVK